MRTVYTIYCYEDSEIKGVFASLEKANGWVEENRKGREDTVYIEEWRFDE